MPPAPSPRPSPYGQATRQPAYQPSSTGHRLCPFPGCGDTVPFFQFACFSHWQRMPGELRDRATALWKDYLDKALAAAALAKARAEVVDAALELDASLGDTLRMSAGHAGLAMTVEECDSCARPMVAIPICGQPGLRIMFDPADSDDGRFVCIAGLAGRLTPAVMAGRPALAKLTPHAETCRGRLAKGVA